MRFTVSNTWIRRFRNTAIILSIGILLYLAGRWALLGGSFPRIPSGYVGVLLRKYGRPLPAGQVVAPATAAGEEPYQGVRQDVLLPGWYPTGYMPWEWDWRCIPQTVIPPNQIGVLTRCFGEDLPEGQVFADENPADEAKGIIRRGPLRKPLLPGIYPINLYAYDVRIFPNRSIGPGQVGVVTKRFGNMPKDPKAFLSDPGERGVQKIGLTSGSYSINPMAEDIRIVSRQSNRLDLGLAGRVRFPSSDGFDISLTGSVEWSLYDNQIPLVYVKFGDTDDTEKKLILPTMRAKSRLQGSRKPAREFISGVTRQTFQDEFAKDLRTFAETEGVKVHAVLISGIVPPDEIAKPIRDREVAMLEQEQYQKEMNTERGRAELERQKELQKRPGILANEQTRSIEKLSQASREQEANLIRARSDYEVAKLEREAAIRQAEVVRWFGFADAEVAKLQMESETAALAGRVSALGGGKAFAKTSLLEKLAPRLTNVSTRADGTLFSLFNQWSNEAATHSTQNITSPIGNVAETK